MGECTVVVLIWWFWQLIFCNNHYPINSEVYIHVCIMNSGTYIKLLLSMQFSQPFKMFANNNNTSTIKCSNRP
jgi:hypothetical protein